MLSAIRYRGPEGAGWARLDQGRLALGFLRLSFTDSATGLQPIFNEDHSVAIVYNGEIYDFEGLRERLRERGHRFRTPSDTEVIVHLYEEFGDAFVEHLNGEFAFALWDAKRRRLLMVRDRFGVKPLFYATRGEQFFFASEAKAILALNDFSTEINAGYFAGPGLGQADTSATPFTGVHSVRPGHWHEKTPTSEAGHRYWTPPFVRPGEERPTFDEAAAGLRKSLRAAVRRRVDGDVPIVAALSSGLDSTIVCGLMAEEAGRAVTAFGLGFDDDSYDESRIAERTARHFKVGFERVVVRPAELAERFLNGIHHTEMATNNLTTTARTAFTAKIRLAGFKAVMSGEGSDELFAGYPYFVLEHLWRSREDPSMRSRLADFYRAERESRGAFWDAYRPSAAADELMGFPSHYARRAVALQRAAPWLLAPGLRQQIRGKTTLDTLRDEFDVAQLRTLVPFDCTRLIARSIMGTFIFPALGDRVEMSASLEGRAPFLDLEVLAAAYRLSESDCLGEGADSKRVLRHAFADLLPPGFASRPKHPFMAPTFQDFSSTPGGAALIESLLSDAAVKRAGLLAPLTVRALRGLHRAVRTFGRVPRPLDAAFGYALSVQALHHVFIDKAAAFRGRFAPLEQVTDLTPRVFS